MGNMLAVGNRNIVLATELRAQVGRVGRVTIISNVRSHDRAGPVMRHHVQPTSGYQHRSREDESRRCEERLRGERLRYVPGRYAVSWGNEGVCRTICQYCWDKKMPLVQ